jgi:hypothetical protein
MTNLVKRILTTIFGIDVRKNNPSYQDATTSQAGQSVHEHGSGFEERARSDMAPFRPGIDYQIMEKSPVEQNSIDIDDPCNTKRMKRW